jgi:ATP-binding cassette, subfamily B, bacterial
MPSFPTLRGYWHFTRIAFRVSPLMTIATAVATIITGIAPLATALLVGLTISQIPSSSHHRASATPALVWAGAIGVVVTVQWVASALATATTTALGDRVNLDLQRGMMASSLAPDGIAHLEDPASIDLLSVGRETFRSWLKPGRLATTLSQLAISRVLLLGAALFLATYRWPLAVAYYVAALWAEREGLVASRLSAEHHHGGTALARRTEYFYDLAVTPGAAKEIRVFGLPGFLLQRFSTNWSLGMAHVMGQGTRRAQLAGVALGAVTVGTFVWLCVDSVGLGLARTLVYAQAVLIGLSSLNEGARARLDSELALATLRRYEESLEVVPTADPRRSAAPALAATGRPAEELRFDKVSFAYVPALRELDLVIPSGKSLAIVGANGAGKTTLVKLLCGLYRPTGGRILVDGHDLADLDLADWRRQIAAVFQDHVRFQLAAASNVGLGRVGVQDDLDGIRAAAAQAGVSEAIETLPGGWDTVLSTDYENGTDLSGGEWQKIALARALFAIAHGAQLLVLDEPAANLDARAEAQLYEHFLALTQGVTTIVISHRFSTVRQAASIAVISDGQVIEQGSHDELLARGGQYELMFRLQAARFEDPRIDEEASLP